MADLSPVPLDKAAIQSVTPLADVCVGRSRSECGIDYYDGGTTAL